MSENAISIDAIVADLERLIADELASLKAERDELQNLQNAADDADGVIASNEAGLERLKSDLRVSLRTNKRRAGLTNGAISVAEQKIVEARRVKELLPDPGETIARIRRVESRITRRLGELVTERNRVAGGRIVQTLRDVAIVYLEHHRKTQEAVRSLCARHELPEPAVDFYPDLAISQYRDGHPLVELARALRSRNLQWFVDNEGLLNPAKGDAAK